VTNARQLSTEERVALLASSPEAAASKSSILAAAGISVAICASLRELTEKVTEGCDAIIVAAESLDSQELQALADLLRSQQAWSDVPAIVIASDNPESQAGLHALKTTLPNSNVMFLHRPVVAASLTSAVQFALRARHRQYEMRQQAALLDLTHDAVIVRKKNGGILFWNRAAEELYGWSREEAIGRISHDLLHSQPSVGELEAALEKSEQWTGELRHTSRDGREVIVESRHQLIQREDGSVQVLETNHDVTDRKRAEQALCESEERLRLAVEAANVGTWDFNPITGTLTWDEICKGVFGLPADAPVDYQTFLAGLHPADREATDLAVQRALQFGGSGQYDIEYRTIGSRDGVERWAAAKGRAVFENGKAVRFIGTIRDITHRKRSEIELQRARDDAEEANKAKDQFLAALSHELRTPLTPVLMTVSSIQSESALSDPLREDLDMIKRNVELEARLIDDLLDLTKISHGKVELERETVNMHVLIVHTVQICTGESGRKKAPVHMHLRATDFHVEGDAARLQQVLWNLINNALKFTPEDGRIDISSSNPAPGKFAIDVADSGIGIEPGAMPRLFAAFEQGGSVITRRYGGLGLGLAIGKALTDLHGGVLSGRSEGANQGAVFTMELNTVAPPAETPAEPVSGRSMAKPLRILLIEDHEHTLHALTRLLVHARHHVQPAPSYAAAKRAAENDGFDLIISDLGLPDGSGLDLLRELREVHHITAPAIALSGYGMEEDLRASRAAGFIEHVTKPVDWKRLEHAIAHAVENKV
jgi:PAS domain S-box-containing protein